MKRKILTLMILAFAVVLSTCSFVYAQGGGQMLRQRCPNSSAYQTFTLASNGNQYATTCSSGNLYVNGIAVATGGGSVTGGTANYLPRYLSATTIGTTPLSWNGTLYFFNNTALDSEFGLEFFPSTAAGRFRVGDFTATPTTYFQVITASNSVTGSCRTCTLGDVAATGNGTVVTIDDTSNAVEFFNTLNAGTLAYTGISFFNYRRTITAGGTTGDQTINMPAGTVNIAAGAATVTVTNSTVTVNSIIVPVARTNDATCSVKNYVPSAGSFVINMTANCTAETSVGFLVTN